MFLDTWLVNSDWLGRKEMLFKSFARKVKYKSLAVYLKVSEFSTHKKAETQGKVKKAPQWMLCH